MQHHPDLNPGDETASARFQEIKESYKGQNSTFGPFLPSLLFFFFVSSSPFLASPVLINDEARKLYNDQIGFHHSDPPPQYHRWGPPPPNPYPTPPPTPPPPPSPPPPVPQGVDPAGGEDQGPGQGLQYVE